MSSFEQLRRARSPLHKKMQSFLEENSPLPLVLEHRFSQIGRIADAFIESKKLIIEIQTSPIRPTEALQRIEDYGSLGCSIRWLLYKPLFQSSLTSRLLIEHEALLFSYHTAPLFHFEDFDNQPIPLATLFTPPGRIRHLLSHLL